MTFEPSNRVQLISGGDPMTVESINGDQVTCVVQTRHGPKRKTFAAAVLKLYQPARAIIPVIG